jgi:hypothetical protein
MIAFHFPPAAMGSGHLRTLGFARYLPEHGWEPLVLTANPTAYPAIDSANEDLVPNGCILHRALALDAQRHLGIRGKYLGIFAKPDRWVSWWLTATWQGMRLIRRHHVDAVWSTYPIMTAHKIACTLSHRSGLPWIADFRDPLTGSISKETGYALQSQLRHEHSVMQRASRVAFTTQAAMRDYGRRFPDALQRGRLCVIPNGYDEAAFPGLTLTRRTTPRRPLCLVHSGLLYPNGRNPQPFLTAMANLKATGALTPDDVHIVLRASGSGSLYAEAIRQRDLADMVTLAPPISNRDALQEQADADGLLLFQGRRFDQQIPAKVYEYLRIGRPIFAMVGEDGETATLLKAVDCAVLAPLDIVDSIETRLLAFVRDLMAGKLKAASTDVEQYSRRSTAGHLADLLNRVTKEDIGAGP